MVDATGRFVGLITEREIVRKTFGNSLDCDDRIQLLSTDEAARYLSAWDVMIPGPDILHPDDCIEDAIEIINSYGYRYMPVTRDREKLDGIVDARELYQHVQAKTKEMMDRKDNLLSYFTHPELYGGAGGYDPHHIT